MKKRALKLDTLLKVVVYESEVSSNYTYKKESRILFGQILWRSEGIYDWHGRKVCNIDEISDECEDIYLKDGIVYDKAELRLEFTNHSRVIIYYDKDVDAMNMAGEIISLDKKWIEY